ncbi:alpha/beta hydrolase [Micromonospora echinofusca]|uniref:Alpha/beta hydrolase n=1 Tax=Micromonospora echinofusca TaxID=47858 RepID=A0ABS3VL57_MICEH|nr:alpha/beta hydrolase [Micromonospora echinofusca]MBO4205259.1 alpha/beta hydrolase [Micromonospora echinofusca]
MAGPVYLNPFVLPVDPVTPERHGPVDLYLPAAAGPRPAVVFVHGGPLPADLRPTPRDWPVFQGYGSLVAGRGLVGVTVDHRLHDTAGFPTAVADVEAAVRTVRADPRVTADRIALWFFSGGGLLLAHWLRTPPDWLRCVAATYPMLAPLDPTVDPGFTPVEAVAGAGDLPIVLTRVGLENEHIAGTVEAFVAAARSARSPLTVVDVPNGRHGFDMLDPTAESRQAVQQAMDAVAAALT